MYKVAMLMTRSLSESLFRSEDLEFLKTFATINPVEELPETITIGFMAEQLRGADACITCWGTPCFTKELLDDNPNLRFIMHAAGAVRNLVCPEFWDMKGRHISSNAPVIAKDVAQTTLAFMMSALKQFWPLHAMMQAGKWNGGESGNFTTKNVDKDLTVGIIGCSLVGKEVINILKPFGCRIRVWDPYLSPLEADMFCVEKTELNELLSSSDVITMHAPANEDCRNIINAENVRLIPDGAVFINTARGLEVDEPALIQELRTGRFFACIDVYNPEPPAPDNPLRNMPNVVATPHRAGGHTIQNRHLMGRNAIKEVYNYLTKGLIAYEVRSEMLSHMA
ncbi:MAG: hydroxyacid dehydrogenase [Christensenellales bacterium]|jgi:phosphoglycerate dehydrogenase-like enzyme